MQLSTVEPMSTSINSVYFFISILIVSIIVPLLWTPLMDFEDLYEDDLQLPSNLIPHRDHYKIEEVDESYINCSRIEENDDIIGYGWQKQVFSMGQMAVKKPYLEGVDYMRCISEFHVNHSLAASGERERERFFLQTNICKTRLISTFTTEIIHLSSLQRHLNVLKLISYCIPINPTNNIHNVRIVTERGHPLTILMIIQLDVQQFIQIVSNIVSFVNDMTHEGFVFNDFRRQQFVMIGTIPKFVDFDGIERKHVNSSNYLMPKLISEFVDPFLEYVLGDEDGKGLKNAKTVEELEKRLKEVG